ncbi:WD40 repeat domain-containing protein [Actinomadura sp. 7K534]|uniref:WD40 repeat domain-containing protein n=1 Tax=Actinomadura sp. 7K534 TaxID=2530366 RepID=UPI001050551A|nr:WD40 repeat domain-containing protein [Actinomadura sp. 7K534]TDB86348.1 hypothetical protein E1266_34345 [Actinomadura sp. 7K534]
MTASEPHYDGDCARPHTHDCAATAVRIWDAATGELVRTVEEVGGRHLVVTVVDGRTAAVTCGWSDTPQLIDLESGVVLDGLAGHRDVVQGLATAALRDGPAVVSVGWDQTIRVTDLTTGEARVVDTGERLHSVAVVLLGDRAVAAVAGEDVGLWDLEPGVRIGSLSATADVRKIATWPDGDALVALLSWQDGVEVWDVSERRLVCRTSGHHMTQDIVGVVTEDGRRLAAISDHEAVHLWDVDARRPVGQPVVGPTGWCALASEGPGGLVTASGPDEAIGVWRVGPEPPHHGTGHTSTITCVAVAPGGVVAGGTDGTVGWWRPGHGRGPVVGALPAPVRAVAAVAAGDGVTVVAGGGDLHGTTDDALHRWIDGGGDQPVIVDHRGEVRIVVTAVLDGRPVTLTAGCDATLCLTDVASGERLGDIPGRHQPDGVAVGLMGGRPVAAVSRAFGPFQLWDLSGDVPMATPVGDAMEALERVHAFVQLDGGPAVATVRGHVARIRDLRTGTTWHLDSENREQVTAVAIREDGSPLAAVARMDGLVRIFDLRARTAVDTLTLPYAATALAWTPDGDLLVACRRDLLLARR